MNRIQVLALDIDGVLTDGRVLQSADGQEQKFVSFRDIEAIFEARRRGLQVALVTGEDTPWVDFIARRLQIGQVLRGAKDKLAALTVLADRLKVPISEICYVGDSDRDAQALGAVGLGLTPADATAQAKASAHAVLKARGGRGAVYEAIGHALEACAEQK